MAKKSTFYVSTKWLIDVGVRGKANHCRDLCRADAIARSLCLESLLAHEEPIAAEREFRMVAVDIHRATVFVCDSAQFGTAFSEQGIV